MATSRFDTTDPPPRSVVPVSPRTPRRPRLDGRRSTASLPTNGQRVRRPVAATSTLPHTVHSVRRLIHAEESGGMSAGSRPPWGLCATGAPSRLVAGLAADLTAVGQRVAASAASPTVLPEAATKGFRHARPPSVQREPMPRGYRVSTRERRSRTRRSGRPCDRCALGRLAVIVRHAAVALSLQWNLTQRCRRQVDLTQRDLTQRDLTQRNTLQADRDQRRRVRD